MKPRNQKKKKWELNMHFLSPISSSFSASTFFLKLFSVTQCYNAETSHGNDYSETGISLSHFQTSRKVTIIDLFWVRWQLPDKLATTKGEIAGQKFGFLSLWGMAISQRKTQPNEYQPQSETPRKTKALKHYSKNLGMWMRYRGQWALWFLLE